MPPQVVAPDAPGATVVVRGVQTEPAAVPWLGPYQVVPAPSFVVRSPRAPVLVPDNECAPALTAFLQEEGFALGEDGAAGAEGLRINGYTSFAESDKRALVDFIEGLHRFKSLWASEASPLPYYFYPTVKGFATEDGTSIKRTLMSIAVRMTPRPLLPRAGALLYRHLG